MWFLARFVLGPIVKLLMFVALAALLANLAGLDPVAMLEQYATNWLWSQI